MNLKQPRDRANVRVKLNMASSIVRYNRRHVFDVTIYGVCLLVVLLYWSWSSDGANTVNQPSHQGVQHRGLKGLHEEWTDTSIVGKVHKERHIFPVCPPEKRLKLLHAWCQREPTRTGEHEQRNLFHNAVPEVLIDHHHHVIYVLIPKGGSRSMLEFFAGLVNTNGTIPGHADFYRTKGLDFQSPISIDDMNGRYGNFRKFIVVRHPLQKMVSAYFEVVQKREKLGEECEIIRKTLYGQPAETCRNRKLSFPEFAEAMAEGLLTLNQHWAPMRFQGRPCEVTPDLIMKTETLTHDNPFLNDLLGIDSDRGVGHIHMANRDFLDTGVISPDLVKYDKMLQSLELQKPDVFKWLLDFYGPDMRSFGYTWDSASGRSGCSYDAVNLGCC